MLKRAARALIAVAVISAGSAGSAYGAGFDTNHGKPADNGSCIAFFSNGGAQAGFIQDVHSEGPGAVGDLAHEFGRSGGNGGAAKNDCA